MSLETLKIPTFDAKCSFTGRASDLIRDNAMILPDVYSVTLQHLQGQSTIDLGDCVFPTALYLLCVF